MTTCDAQGNVSSVEDILDVYDDGNECTADYCDNGVTVHPLEAIGTPCLQGYCDSSGKCVECIVNNHCITPAICKSGKCVPQSCTNMLKDGNETDVDCGGSCTACTDGNMCMGAFDCASKACNFGICIAPSCQDQHQNGDETAVNCGGSVCPPCGSGQSCAEPIDCISGVCVAGTCIAPSCTDGVKNGGETGVDCGGTCASCP